MTLSALIGRLEGALDGSKTNDSSTLSLAWLYSNLGSVFSDRDQLDIDDSDEKDTDDNSDYDTDGDSDYADDDDEDYDCDDGDHVVVGVNDVSVGVDAHKDDIKSSGKIFE